MDLVKSKEDHGHVFIQRLQTFFYNFLTFIIFIIYAWR